MAERDHQVFVFQVLGMNESQYPFLKYAYAIPNGGHRHPAVGAKLKAEGVKRGISDICLPFASADKWFVGAYIEMKDGNKKPTPEQRDFLDFVARERYCTTVAKSCDEALDFIEGYIGGKLRGRR